MKMASNRQKKEIKSKKVTVKGAEKTLSQTAKRKPEEIQTKKHCRILTAEGWNRKMREKMGI